MAVSKKNIRRVLEGEKRVRAFKERMETPANNPLNKDGERKQVRARFVRKDVEHIPEQVNREDAIRSGGIMAEVSVRSADAKFGKWHKEHADLYQGKVQISKIDGHVYGSVQKIGRSLVETRLDNKSGKLVSVVRETRMQSGKLVKMVHNAVDYGDGLHTALPDVQPAPVSRKPNKPSPFKRRWQESTFVLEKR